MIYLSSNVQAIIFDPSLDAQTVLQATGMFANLFNAEIRTSYDGTSNHSMCAQLRLGNAIVNASITLNNQVSVISYVDLTNGGPSTLPVLKEPALGTSEGFFALPKPNHSELNDGLPPSYNEATNGGLSSHDQSSNSMDPLKMFSRVNCSSADNSVFSSAQALKDFGFDFSDIPSIIGLGGDIVIADLSTIE